MGKVQVIKYKCCGKTFAACCEPDCYTDKDWLTELKKYISRGDIVEMIDDSSEVQFGRCECNKQLINVTPSISQISLFDKHQNFISVDGKTVINSYGQYFTVGEIVKHDDSSVGEAKIISFEPITERNEIRVETDKGYAHIDFLVKIN